MSKIDLSKAKKIETRVIARGETTGHSHIITGNCEVYELDGSIYIDARDDSCVIRHLLETPFVEEGREVWTGEHKDIPLRKGINKYVPEVEFNPFDNLIRRIED